MKEKLTPKQKVLRDMKDQLDETKRMGKHPKRRWRIRAYMGTIEYWCVAYCFPLSICIGLLTHDFWKGLGLWIGCQLYIFGANFRGMSLHIENAVEWLIEKTI